MDICIAGAGIGGLALAHGLLADGHRVTVVERAAAPTRGGAAVTIFSNGAAALHGLGVDLDGLGARLDALSAYDATGRAVMRADLRVLARRTGHPVRSLPRAELIDRLTAALPPGTIRYGDPVDTVRPAHGEIELAGGERLRADVVVGADGYRSAVRRAVLDPAPAYQVGWDTWQGLSPVLPELTAGRLLIGTAGLVGLLPAGQGRTQWWFDVPTDRAADAGTVGWLRRRFGGYADPVPALLDRITDGDVGRYPHVRHQVPDAWGTGPVTLLGDAAHVFPPSQAQGANQALEDAWLLRRALRGDPVDTAAALRRYERERTPRVRRVSAMAAAETTNRPLPAPLALLTRAVPAGLGGLLYLRRIRRFSSVLSDRRR